MLCNFLKMELVRYTRNCELFDSGYFFILNSNDAFYYGVRFGPLDRTDAIESSTGYCQV
jgi:hypothetical protein